MANNFWNGAGYLGSKVGAGFMQSVEGIWDFAAGGIADVVGADAWAEKQFANDWFGEWYQTAGKKYNVSDNKGWQTAANVAGAIGSALPTIAATVIAGIVTGGAGAPVVASALTAGTSAAGGATKDAYKETGKLGAKEYGYGLLSGTVEAGLEAVTGGVGGVASTIGKAVGKTATKEAAEALAKQTAKGVVKKLATSSAKQFASEAFEEGLSEALSPYLQRLTYDPNAANASIEEIMYAALIGGISGAILDTSTQVTVMGANAVSDSHGRNPHDRSKPRTADAGGRRRVSYP